MSDDQLIALDDQESFDAQVARYLDLRLEQERISSELAVALETLRKYGQGRFATTYGVRVTISPPSRRFNLDRAVELLPAAVLPVCLHDGYDPAKVKRMLSPALLDLAMSPGTGNDRVTVQ